jgi:hypothetical protein
MSAIITDQFRISTALDFIDRIKTSRDNYYLFTGLSNSEEYSPNWNTNPPTFRDSFDEENKVWETMFYLKKISTEDVRPVIKRNTWQSGITYDMYHHKISVDSRSFATDAISLYSAKYYVINKDFRVYICLNNGVDPQNPKGRPSLDEPTFVDLEPRAAGTSGDGYIWKYLYTIKPSEVLKFDSTNYIPVPIDWFTSDDYKEVRENALPTSGSGQLKTILIKEFGGEIGDPGTYSNIPIFGDGSGATAALVVGSDGVAERIFVTNGGSGYTYGIVDISKTSLSLANPPVFEIIIPPRGGHGSDIYRELGAKNVLLYSRIENDVQDPDFIVNNKIARIGIVQNPLAYDSTAELNKNKASAVRAIKIKSPDNEVISVKENSIFTQTTQSGVTAVGRVVSYDKTTGVLKYWQDRTQVGFTTSGSINPFPSYGIDLVEFNSQNVINFETTSGSVDSSFSGDTLAINNNTYYLGQTFQNGLSNPEVEYYSGEIIYVDNRPSISRSLNQKEDIKIILQF